MNHLLLHRIFRTCKRQWSSFLPVHANAVRVLRLNWSIAERQLNTEYKTTFKRNEPLQKSRKFTGYSSPFEIDSTNQVKSLDVEQMEPVRRYQLLCAAIVPRPIALVSTCSVDDVYNLAAFSFFMPVTSDPPSIAFSVTRKRNDQKKDTLINIESTNHFVVNHLSLSIFKRAYTASTEFASDVDEFEAVGLTAVPTLHGTAPRVKEAPLALECSLMKLVDVGCGKHGSSTIVLGKLLHAYVNETCMDGERISAESLGTVSRLGGMAYGRAETHFKVNNDDVWSEKYW